jgi:DNA-binding protein YbaB
MNGERKVLSIKIKTQIKGREELQESLKEAVNRAADEVQRKTVSKIMKEFHIDPSLLP